MALKKLHVHICELLTKHPEAFILVAGDVNNFLPRFRQHISITTKGNNTLYKNRQEAYQPMPRPNLGSSDQMFCLEILLKDLHGMAQRSYSYACDCTDRQVLREAAIWVDRMDVEDYASSVCAYKPKTPVK